jgi:hypothetical protein
MEQLILASNRIKVLILSLMILIGLTSCCINQTSAPREDNGSNNNSLYNTTSAFKDLPEVQQFIAVYPNTTINISHSNQDVINNSLNEIGFDIKDQNITTMYMVLIHEKNSSIVSYFDEKDNLIGMNVLNPPIMNDTSERLLSSNNLTFSIIKIDTNIYVTCTGGQAADEVDYITVTGYNALGHEFETQILGKEDHKYDNIVNRTVKLEGACSSCWKNFVMIYASFTNGDKQTVLKAHV